MESLYFTATLYRRRLIPGSPGNGGNHLADRVKPRRQRQLNYWKAIGGRGGFRRRDATHRENRHFRCRLLMSDRFLTVLEFLLHLTDVWANFFHFPKTLNCRKSLHAGNRACLSTGRRQNNCRAPREKFKTVLSHLIINFEIKNKFCLIVTLHKKITLLMTLFGAILDILSDTAATCPRFCLFVLGLKLKVLWSSQKNRYIMGIALTKPTYCNSFEFKIHL